MKSRIKFDLEDFIRVLSPNDLGKPIHQVDRQNVELDETRLRVMAAHWSELLGRFAGPVAHKPDEWCIDKKADYLPPAFCATYGTTAFLIYEFKAKDVPDARDRIARIQLVTCPASSHGNLIKYAIQVILEELRSATAAQAEAGDSFASNFRIDYTNPRHRSIEYNPFNKGDVKRAFTTVLKEWL